MASGIGVDDLVWLVAAVICVLFVTAWLPQPETRSGRRQRTALYHVPVGAMTRRRTRGRMSRLGRRH